jgi:CheY-like chemotaxis protein
MDSREHFSILLVDDDPIALQLLAAILAEFTPVRFAMSGQTALKLARKSTPDLVLLDVQMADLNGFEICKAFKADPALAHVPIIFSSGQVSVEFEALALELGAVDVITKSQAPTILLAKVRARIAVMRGQSA